ncbi:MAG: hypothetical protein IT435_16920 [Phycisphaerales bacterium]|nr:hypothetical protein [Phycisphaerales bacterium]
MTTPPTPLCGILVIDKPYRSTSMHMCAAVRAKLRRGGAPKGVKVGHGGTLDPLASGVLVVLVGKATRYCNQIMASRKRYTAIIDLAHVSATHDHESEAVLYTPGMELDVNRGLVGPAPGAGVFDEKHVTGAGSPDPAVRQASSLEPPTREQIDLVLARFTGTIDQIPPAHSAVNIAGSRAYMLAREGQAVPLQAKRVEVHSLAVLAYHWPMLTLEIRSGKGFYVRSLARDLGAALETGGMLESLVRTEAAPFTIEQARAFHALPGELTQADLDPIPEGLEPPPSA